MDEIVTSTGSSWVYSVGTTADNAGIPQYTGVYNNAGSLPNNYTITTAGPISPGSITLEGLQQTWDQIVQTNAIPSTLIVSPEAYQYLTAGVAVNPAWDNPEDNEGLIAAERRKVRRAERKKVRLAILLAGIEIEPIQDRYV